jgi:hypothetical protein
MSKQLLLSYSVLDGIYQNGSLRFVRGLQDASSETPAVGTIDNPRDALVPLKPTDPDPKMFSYSYKGEVRMLLSKVVTPVSGSAPYTTWTLLGLPTPPYGPWATLAKDIVLRITPNVQAATNAYGVAHLGDWLYIIDYDSQKIYTLGANELNGMAEGTLYTPTQAPLDLGPGTEAGLLPTTKGQAIIALQDGKGNGYLYALYTNPQDAYATQYNLGYLVRLTVDATTGTPSYDTQCQTGRNSQEIIPLSKTDGTVTLVIPSVGGSQQAGGSNGELSMIQSVDPFSDEFSPTTLVMGADSGTYDIFAVAAPDRADDKGIVYILTYDYTADYSGTNWTLYSTTVANLLTLPTGSELPANFTVVETGAGAPGYFWNLFMETGDNATRDRLWFFRGSPLLATPALAYNTPTEPGNAYKYFAAGTDDGDIGGANVDWVDFTGDAARQAALGKSLKRSVRAVKPPAAAEESEKK